jgi:hypothetical protein
MRTRSRESISLENMMAKEFQPRWAMSRGVLVLDENLHFLEDELKKKRFKVLLIDAHLEREQVIQILIHRIFVTCRASEFLYDAPVEEFSIIDITKAIKDLKVLATQISRAFVYSELRSKEPFLLVVNGNKKPVLKLIY